MPESSIDHPFFAPYLTFHGANLHPMFRGAGGRAGRGAMRSASARRSGRAVGGLTTRNGDDTRDADTFIDGPHVGSAEPRGGSERLFAGVEVDRGDRRTVGAHLPPRDGEAEIGADGLWGQSLPCRSRYAPIRKSVHDLLPHGCLGRAGSH